jgi:hypothetical protein
MRAAPLTQRPARAATVVVLAGGLGAGAALAASLTMSAGDVQVALLVLTALLSGVQGLGSD